MIMSEVYMIGDLHIGHKGIVKHRAIFDNIEDHNETIRSNVKSVGGKNDKLILLGDIVFTKESIPFVQDMVSHFGQIVYIAGNHDLERGINMQDLIDGFGCNIQAILRYKEFWLTHCPIHPAELRGKINIHGHVHSATITTESGDIDKRYFNTSCENVDYTPVSLQEIRKSRIGVRETMIADTRD